MGNEQAFYGSIGPIRYNTANILPGSGRAERAIDGDSGRLGALLSITIVLTGSISLADDAETFYGSNNDFAIVFDSAEGDEGALEIRTGATETLTIDKFTKNVDIPNGSLNVAGALTLGTVLAVAEGGIGIGTLTDHGVLLGSGTSPVTPAAVGTNGQLLVGSTGADPAFQTNIDLPGTLDVTGDVVLDSTLEIKDDTFWTGAGSGLPFGEISANDNVTVTSVSSAGFTQVLIFDTDGASNLATPDHTNDHITVVKAGHYMVNVCATVTNQSGAGHKIELVVAKNNNAAIFGSLRRHRTLASGTDAGAVPICAHVALALDDTIEVWITSDSGSAKNIIVEDITLGLTMIGGT